MDGRHSVARYIISRSDLQKGRGRKQRKNRKEAIEFPETCGEPSYSYNKLKRGTMRKKYRSQEKIRLFSQGITLLFHTSGLYMALILAMSIVSTLFQPLNAIVHQKLLDSIVQMVQAGSWDYSGLILLILSFLINLILRVLSGVLMHVRSKHLGRLFMAAFAMLLPLLAKILPTLLLLRFFWTSFPTSLSTLFVEISDITANTIEKIVITAESILIPLYTSLTLLFA